MLVGLAGIRPGQTVLILGANSGVGTAAIQIAKFFRAQVIATAGEGMDKEHWMTRAGAAIADVQISGGPCDCP